jgi:prolipoprotein diacylglyceryltransferase
VWQGGLQFSGGFVAAVAISYPTFRKWSRVLRWRAIDGYGYGLTIGLAIGRIGCTSVGEHFGSQSSWLLAVRYDGGATRETALGSIPLQKGMTFHNTAIYEFLFLLVLFGILTLLARRGTTAGTLIGVFCIYYGIARGLSDFLRVNDHTVLGLTGAQYLMIALLPASAWILLHVRPRNAALDASVGSSPPEEGTTTDRTADEDEDAEVAD